MRVAHQFKTQNSKLKTQTAPSALRFPQVFGYELYFVWREPLGCLPIALVDEGIVEGFATANPRHETVDSHVWGGCGEIQEGKFLLGVGLDLESCHKWIEALPQSLSPLTLPSREGSDVTLWERKGWKPLPQPLPRREGSDVTLWVWWRDGGKGVN